MKVLLVPMIGKPKELEIPNTSGEQQAELRRLVGGYPEAVHTAPLNIKHNCILVDEDGRDKGKPTNPQAMRISGYSATLVGDAVIVGYIRDALNGDYWGDYNA